MRGQVCITVAGLLEMRCRVKCAHVHHGAFEGDLRKCKAGRWYGAHFRVSRVELTRRHSARPRAPSAAMLQLRRLNEVSLCVSGLNLCHTVTKDQRLRLSAITSSCYLMSEAYSSDVRLMLQRRHSPSMHAPAAKILLKPKLRSVSNEH